jgi:hypothetical protein
VDWTDGLGAEQVALVEAKGWRGPGDVLTSYQHAERHIGRDPNSLVAVPGAASTDEEWGQVYDRLGRPAGPDGYEFEPIEGVDAADDPALAALAHGLGLNPDQAARLREHHYQAAARGMQDQVVGLRSGIQDVGRTLRAEWGHAYGERDRLAARAAEFVGLDAAALGRSGLMNGEHGVRLMQGLAQLGEVLAEDKVLGGGGFASSSAQALGEMEQLKLDQGFLDAYLSREHVGHKAAVERMRRLSEAAWPEPRR